jgi:hypothetical protein
MAFKIILDEVGHLHGVGTRLERYAEEHPRISEGLLGVALSVRNAATILGVLLAANPDPKPSKVQ